MEMDKSKVGNYLEHLDKEGLKQLIWSLMQDTETKNMIITMSEEWDRMYGILK